MQRSNDQTDFELKGGSVSQGRSPRLFISLLSSGQKAKYLILIGLWTLLAFYFWQWWFTPHHNIGMGRYVLVSVCLGWVFFLQLYFLTMFLQARTTNPDTTVPDSLRVAMVVTKTPSEPFSVLEPTLKAMLAQDVPHDTWLADENPEPATTRWCRQHGVKISTRWEREDYHRATWPRRARCKEGNLAFFYDHYGYENYDIVSQLDSDHVPQEGYLAEIVKPFIDPAVGYVSAPSVCASNEKQSWAARARLYAEAMFHGVLQAGYSGGWAPMCIGSHYAVRTLALKDVGGLGPDLAEDHSTTMILNAGGWRGAHAINARAIGAGPATFADMITQEFQWSRSLMTLLLTYLPQYFKGLSPRLKFQFLFAQLWYPLFAVFMAAMFAMPIVALAFGMRFANVTYPAFLGHLLPATIMLVLIAYEMRRDRLFRPINAKVMSWEKMLFPCAQWPWVLWGCIMAVRDRLTGKFVDFRITPKGDGEVALLSNRVLLPYFVLAAASIFPIIIFSDVSEARGFYLLAAINAILYTSLLAAIVFKHTRENNIRWRYKRLALGFQTSLAACLVATSAYALSTRGLEGLDALTKGAEPFSLTETKFVPSGAGTPVGTVRIKFRPRWRTKQTYDE